MFIIFTIKLNIIVREQQKFDWTEWNFMTNSVLGNLEMGNHNRFWWL